MSPDEHFNPGKEARMIGEQQRAQAPTRPRSRSTAIPRHLFYVIKSMRPKQWTKSGIVFIALIFSVNLSWFPEQPGTWDNLLLRAVLTAIAFSMASGADYLVNDRKDVESDRFHPKKSKRPIAAGLISPNAALGWAVVLDCAALAIAYAIELRVGVVLTSYVILMIFYTYYLKYEVILDVMVIAAGFVLRAMAGAYAIDVPISPWLYVVAGLGALFLAITKRRAEVVSLEGSAASHRSTLAFYTPALIDQMTAVATTSTVIAYALYTFTGENLPTNHAMMLTIPFVAYGIFRYLFLSSSRNEGGHPEEVLLKDVPLMLTLVGWVSTSAIILTVSR